MGVDELSQGGAVRDTDGDGIAEILQDIDGQGNDITNLNLLSTDEIFASPGHTLMLADRQSIPDSSLTQLTFGTVGDDVFGLADLSNNAIQIPSNPDFNHIKAEYTLFWNSDPGRFDSQLFLNGSAWPDTSGRASMGFNPGLKAINSNTDLPTSSTGWTGVSGDETITLEVTQTSGGAIDIREFATWIEVTAQ